MKNLYSNLRQKLTNVERKIFGDYLASEISPKQTGAIFTLGGLLLFTPSCKTLDIQNPFESYGSAQTDTRKLKEGTTTHKIKSYAMDGIKACKGTGNDVKCDNYFARSLPDNKTVVIAGKTLDRSLILEGTYLIPDGNHDETITSTGVKTKSNEMYALVNVIRSGKKGIAKVNNCNKLEETTILYDRGNLKTKTKDKGKKFVVQKRTSSTQKKLQQLLIGKNKNKYDIINTKDGIAGNLDRLQITILDSQGDKKDGYITRISVRDGKTKTSHLKRGMQYVPVRINRFADHAVPESDPVDENNGQIIQDLEKDLVSIPTPTKKVECTKDFGVSDSFDFSEQDIKTPKKKRKCSEFEVENNSVVATPSLNISCIKDGIEGYKNYTLTEFVDAFKSANDKDKFLNGDNKVKLKQGETYTLPQFK
ncbi:hypothetical protein CMI49_01745 [Candidatus Pacearchaeota archaeon]|jgi:hypothetical protein|nr:hypothetical protein [Candidatus Pacearchaeota archaeon]|tara:strand:- start:782 stop:2044 length:1263 start_codon:yes stop_codon:yes gene_type:complete